MRSGQRAIFTATVVTAAFSWSRRETGPIHFNRPCLALRSEKRWSPWLREALADASPPRSGATESDPFVWNELQAGLAQRKQRAAELDRLAERARLHAFVLAERLKRGELSDNNFSQAMHMLRQKVLRESALIMYSIDDAHARQRYLEANGCVKATPRAIDAVRRVGKKVVELGAGAGHWQLALSNAGVDIVSFDSFELVPTVGQVGKVGKGNEKVLSSYPDRALLLVYPPPGEMANKCLAAYQGEVLIYVGEGRGGANATDEFFNELAAKWTVRQVVILEETFPFCYERLFVLDRKP